jgi:hypothetical protein
LSVTYSPRLDVQVVISRSLPVQFPHDIIDGRRLTDRTCLFNRPRLSDSWFPGRDWISVCRVTSRAGGGLGNRLRGMCTSLVLAQELGFGLDIFWGLEGCAGTHFLDLFGDRGLSFLSAGPETLELCTDPEHPQPWFRFRSNRRFPETAAVDGTLHLARLPRESFTLKTWHNLKPDNLSDDAFLQRKHSFLSTLQPIPDIQTRIDAIVDTFGEETVGVHVRATDSNFRWKGNAGPALDLYFTEVIGCLEEAAHTVFFVSADDDAIVEQFHSRFGKRIRSSIQVLGRRGVSRWSREGQVAAVVDLFCLSKTNKIIGTRFSTFSYEAAALGTIPLVEVSGVPNWKHR